ncbi:MAG: hypothetical protein GFH27_549309n107 [Chloroflexi bacterium AL-W]|nr:hypothetical protein [Chloroflexi bacterium AL-N1]NOK69809.1 hypothetical protein [Chloroflexi bacterium AL-N10]NOK73587.1 hypothetical protein [Chloroflexi bacterium AL-N5]NOK83979.1 hypothetical protein [Chloroflexi bacterium AL-W]NOK87918.1 hypothetical protein [Chloroflexi bacterium AL-N15]
MPHPDTSAANPLILLDYATTGFELCERERQLARELAPLLEHVAATCIEYAINVGEFDLVNRINSSADKTDSDHDRWLHNVAIDFLDADGGEISARVLEAIQAYEPSSQADINALTQHYRDQGWTDEEVQAFLILAKMEHLQYQQQLLAPYTDEVLDEMLALADAMEQGGQSALDAYRAHGNILALPDQALGEIASQLTIVDAHSLRLMVFQIRQRQAELDRDLGLQEIALAELTDQPPSVIAETQARVNAAQITLLGTPEVLRQIAELEERQWELEEALQPASHGEELAHIKQELAQLRQMSPFLAGLNQQVDHAAEALTTEQRQLQELTDSYQAELSAWETEYRQDISSVLDVEQDRLDAIRQDWESRDDFSPRVNQILSDVEQAIYSSNPNDLQKVLQEVRADPNLTQLELELDILYIFGAYGNPLADATSVATGDAVGIDPRMNMVDQRENFVRTVNPSQGDILTQQALSVVMALPWLKGINILESVALISHHHEMAQDPYISEEARDRHREDSVLNWLDLSIDSHSDGVDRLNQNRSSRLNEHNPTLDALRAEGLPTARTNDEIVSQGLLMMRVGDNPEDIVRFLQQETDWRNYINSNGFIPDGPPAVRTSDDITAQGLHMMEAGDSPEDVARFLQQETARQNYVNSYERIEAVQELGQVTDSFSDTLSLFSVGHALENAGIQVADESADTNDISEDAVRTLTDIQGMFSSENDFGPSQEDRGDDNNLSES